HELHMEEDAGKLVHDPWIDQTKCDYNRCGVPLIEIVTEPDFRSADEVIAYLEKLKSTLEYLGVSDCKMQEGSLRCDVNLSVRPAGSGELGTRTEMKNLNSFKAISRAIAYEAKRQVELIEEGKRVVQETRRWDDNKDATFSMRSKENAQDYRYFPEPDIPPIELSEDDLEQLKQQQPEMAEARRARYQVQYGLPEYDAGILTSQKALVDFFEEAVGLGAPAKEVSNWMLGDMMRRLKEEEMEPKDMKFSPANLVRMIGLISDGKINRNTAAKVFRAIFPDNTDAEEYVRANGLEQVNDAGLVKEAVEKVFAANAAAVADSRTGNQKVMGFLVGQVMKELKGKADPKKVNQAVRDSLEV
ncbi:MAG: Asp-tRNA(Asn)/Glu-tRNA(Gln) amidotransferase subunit GatB, partial [Lawsonibacter sp.]|nr:Asp-tRNA(Asn)/Glu-tRNA(Gln) amidotransferase subunit GatB [Lawsonibacter sp.]